MSRSRFGAATAGMMVLLAAAGWSATATAQTVMQQCGQQYQAAKAAGTLNGTTWAQYRTECAARLKGAAPEPATAAAPATPANPLKPVAATPAAASAPAPVAPGTAAAPVAPASGVAAAPAKPATGGRAAFVARERQCGTEWKASKASLVAATPGLTWPKYLSQCNTRLKAAGQ